MPNLTSNKANPTEFSRTKAGEFVELISNSGTPNETGRYFVFTDRTSLKFWNGSSTTTLGSGGGGGASGGLDSAYSIDPTINVDSGAITLTDATAGAANTVAFVKSGAGSGNVIDMIASAAFTGAFIDIAVSTGVAATGIHINNSTGARTGADILVKSDSTGTHSVIDINASGSGAVTAFDFVGSYNGNGGGEVFKITFDANDNLTTEIMEVRQAQGFATSCLTLISVIRIQGQPLIFGI